MEPSMGEMMQNNKEHRPQTDAQEKHERHQIAGGQPSDCGIPEEGNNCRDHQNPNTKLIQTTSLDKVFGTVECGEI